MGAITDAISVQVKAENQLSELANAADTDVLKAVSDIRRNYKTKLEEVVPNTNTGSVSWCPICFWWLSIKCPKLFDVNVFFADCCQLDDQLNFKYFSWQSDKRKHELLAEIMLEEERGKELKKIVGELLPNPKSSPVKRTGRGRKVFFLTMVLSVLEL